MKMNKLEIVPQIKYSTLKNNHISLKSLRKTTLVSDVPNDTGPVSTL